MKSSELLALIASHSDEITDALREAERMAFKYTTCEYSVALFPDGHTEQRERLAGDSWYYMDDPAILELGPFCYQYYDVLRDNLASDELLTLLESEMGPDETIPYAAWRERYEEEECDFPDDWDAVNWIEEHCFDLWERVREKAIEELVTCQEAEDTRENLLAYQIEMYIKYQTA